MEAAGGGMTMSLDSMGVMPMMSDSARPIMPRDTLH
jgi:hypothetical protein